MMTQVSVIIVLVSTFIKHCLTSCKAFSVRQVTPLAALSAGFPSHSMKFLGKYQFLGVHSFSGLISKQKDTFLLRETSSLPDWLQFNKLLFKCFILEPSSQTFRYTDKNVVRIAYRTEELIQEPLQILEPTLSICLQNVSMTFFVGRLSSKPYCLVFIFVF